MILDIPAFLPGEIVLHRIPSPKGGEILHIAMIIGLVWSGVWEYALSIPDDHPEFEDCEGDSIEWLNSWQIEKIDPEMQRLIVRSFTWVTWE